MTNISDVDDELARTFANRMTVSDPRSRPTDARNLGQDHTQGLLTDTGECGNKRNLAVGNDGDAAAPAQKRGRFEAEQGPASITRTDEFPDNGLSDAALNRAYDEVIASRAQTTSNAAMLQDRQAPAPSGAGIVNPYSKNRSDEFPDNGLSNEALNRAYDEVMASRAQTSSNAATLQTRQAPASIAANIVNPYNEKNLASQSADTTPNPYNTATASYAPGFVPPREMLTVSTSNASQAGLDERHSDRDRGADRAV